MSTVGVLSIALLFPYINHIAMVYIITSTKEAMFLGTFVCFHDNSKTNKHIFMWIEPEPRVTD